MNWQLYLVCHYSNLTTTMMKCSSVHFSTFAQVLAELYFAGMQKVVSGMYSTALYWYLEKMGQNTIQ